MLSGEVITISKWHLPDYFFHEHLNCIVYQMLVSFNIVKSWFFVSCKTQRVIKMKRSFFPLQFPEYAGGIRSIALVNPGSADGKMLIGTTRNHIMQGSLQTKFVYVTQVGWKAFVCKMSANWKELSAKYHRIVILHSEWSSCFSYNCTSPVRSH